MDLHPLIRDNHLAGPTRCSPEVYTFQLKCKLNQASPSALSHSTPPTYSISFQSVPDNIQIHRKPYPDFTYRT
eukprot:scaffold209517_cov15-Prasinocladus_malaysianus.AAC.1